MSREGVCEIYVGIEGEIKIEEGIEEGTEEERVRNTARFYRVIAITIMPESIEMEEDVGCNHEDGYIPILDTKMRMHEGGIIHKFYAKPMTTREVIGARSSIPTTNKMNTKECKTYNLHRDMGLWQHKI